MIMPRNFIWWATAVLLLAAVLRLATLQNVPPGLAQDEVLNADVVLFIRQGYHALFFPEGYGHEPLYHYWSVPFQILLGDNVLSIRLPAVYLGLFLIALTLRWALREFGGATAVLTGAFLAISWWPIIFSRIGLRPIMEPVFLLLFAWFWPRRPWLAGLVLGLSLYTYTGARVIFLLPLLLAIYAPLRLLRWRGRRIALLERDLLWTQLRPALIVLGMSLLVYLPLGLTLRANPEWQQRVQQLEGPLAALRQGDFAPISAATAATLGVFSFSGDPRWTYSLPGRPLFDGITAVFFYAGFLLVLLRWRQPRYGLVLIWLLVGILPSAVTPEAPSTVRLIGALPVIFLLPALSISWLWQRVQDRPVWRPLVAAAVVVLLAFNLWRTWQDGFVRWPQALETRLKYQTLQLDMARYLRASPAEALVIADGFYRPITADTLRRSMNANPNPRWVQTGDQAAGALALPAAENGRFLAPEFAVPAPELMAAAGFANEPLYRSPGKPSFAEYLLPAQIEQPLLPATVTFEGVLTLTGYEILPHETERPLKMITFWRVKGPLPADLAAFVHLVDAEGQLISQHDGFDAAPLTLQTGDQVLQLHDLPLPDLATQGPYTLQLGLYTRGNGRRLILDAPGEGQPVDRLILQSIYNIDVINGDG